MVVQDGPIRSAGYTNGKPNRVQSAFREKAGEELREFIILTAYLYVCFAAVLYFKAAVLQAQGIACAPLGLAKIKAAICAKFMLMGRVFHLGDRFKKLPLIVPSLQRSFVFLLLLAVLTYIEEIVVGAIHGRTVLDSISEVAGGTLLQIGATVLIIFLILVPYFAFRALGEIVGDKIPVRLFLERTSQRLSRIPPKREASAGHGA